MSLEILFHRWSLTFFLFYSFPVALNDNHDADLIVALTQGDEKAFARIYQSYWRTLYDTAMQRLRDEDQAKDIVQDVFVRMWDQRESLVINNLQAYLQAAVRYRIYNLVAKEKINDHYLKYLSGSANVQSGPDESLRYTELLRHYTLVLEHMPEKRREIFQLRFNEEMSTKHIADKLNITQKTVQNQLIKAVQYLKNALSSTFFFTLFFLLVIPFF